MRGLQGGRAEGYTLLACSVSLEPEDGGVVKSQKSQARTIRWSLAMMSREFGPDHKTLSKALAASGIVAGKDGLYSSKEALRLVCGDIDAERLRKTREEADKLAIENATALGELVDVRDFVKRYEPIYAQIWQTIMASTLPDNDKDALLTALAKLHSDSGRPDAKVQGDSPRAGRAAVAKAKA